MPSRTIKAKVTHRFGAPPERVYDAFFDPAQVVRWRREWLGEGVCEPDATQDGDFMLADLDRGDGAQAWGRYKALERPKKISFSWSDPGEEDDPSEVTMIIEPEPDGAGSVITLYHSMDERWAGHSARAEKGWAAMLAGLDRVLSAS